jgi:hypothetical protein
LLGRRSAQGEIQMLNQRIIQKIDQYLPITKQTTPIPYFGNYNKANACTISINPSDREFCDKNGSILNNDKERLCSRKRLQKKDNEELTIKEANIILGYCDNYFHKRPYRLWFDKYEKFLQIFGYSYYEDQVVHLDLVQWATTPFWGKIDDKVKNQLLTKDLPFLKSMLEKNFEYIFLNGKTVVAKVSKHLNILLYSELVKVNQHLNTTVYFGNYKDTKVLGWSTYLQSKNAGGYEQIQELARKIKKEEEKRYSTIAST